jgi:hypothetical protein
MLFLMLFSTLAVGYAAATAMNAQISRNDRNLSEARFAADAGMSFVRYQLGLLDIPSGQTGSTLLATVATQLGTQLNGTANMGGHLVAVTNGTIYIPAQGSYIATGSGNASKFQVAITVSNSTLIVTTTGYDSTGQAGRGDQLQFQQFTLPSAIFNYGVAAKGEIESSGGATIQGTPTAANGSVLSATAGSAALNQGGGTISGDFSYTNGAATNTYGGSIDGYTKTNSNFSQHVHSGVAAPQFPSVDTTVYAQYATNTWSTTTGSSVINCIVPAGANPSFPAGTTVQGVLYIQTPNKVTFSGSCTIQGCVIVEDNPQGTSNSLTFGGGVTAQSISTLPATAQFPAAERALTGAFILAPSFAVTMSGNFGTIGGSLIADSFNFSGSVTATVDGSIIALKDTPMVMSGGTVLTVSGAGNTGYPPGVNFGFNYIPVQGSFIEVNSQ